MSTEGRVEYAQVIDADWQVPVSAAAVAVIIVAFVAVLYSPSLQNQQGSVRSATDRLGQLRGAPASLQPSAGSTQGTTAAPLEAGGGLQAAGSVEAFNQFQGGQ